MTPRDDNGLITPHGGAQLVTRQATEDLDDELRAQLLASPVIPLNPREQADLDLIACGALTPLEGFMDRATVESVMREAHLPGGVPWTLPITLSVDAAIARKIKPGERVGLEADGRLVGMIEVDQCWAPDKEAEARATLGTDDLQHPGVRYLLQEAHDHYVGGRVTTWQQAQTLDEAITPWLQSPAQLRQAMADKGWRNVVGFQTRNPMHRAHEYLTRCALEGVDGLLLHPLVGPTRSEDIPAHVRIKTYEVLLENYYPAAHTMLSVYPAAMRYAGPAEAIMHAIVRRNYGCSHFIVGRDHAGVGKYYGTYDAQERFADFDARAMGIVPLCFEHAFYSPALGGMATVKTIPEGSERVMMSGSEVRAMLRRGELPPPEIMRCEVAQILRQAMMS